MNGLKNNIEGHKFEVLIEKLIRKMGFKTQRKKITADGGIDIFAVNKEPLTKGMYIIQCKKYSKPISEAIIRDLFGVMTSERANKGILITNSTFTNAAKKFARGKPIELIDGDELSILLKKNLIQNDSNSKISKNQEIEIPEVYEIALEILEPEIKNIIRRKQKILEGVIFFENKYLEIEDYVFFFQGKIKRLSELIGVQVKQLNYLNMVFNNSINETASNNEINEAKIFCGEVIKVTKLILQDLEELHYTIPPEHFRVIQELMFEAYDHLISKMGIFIDSLSVIVKSCKGLIFNPNIKKELNIVIDLPKGWEDRMKVAIKKFTEEAESNFG